MKMYLAKGRCQKCGAREVIAHSGYKHMCHRCNSKLYDDISELQKENYMRTGRVNGQKSANSFGNPCKNT